MLSDYSVIDLVGCLLVQGDHRRTGGVVPKTKAPKATPQPHSTSRYGNTRFSM